MTDRAGTNKPRSGLLRWIAVFKLLKAATMVVVGIAILKLAHHHSEETLNQLVEKLGIDPDRGFIDHAIGRLVSISPEKLEAAGVASFVYAALFLTEGIGLWLGKRWAEWFTVIVTLSLVPLEIYELHHHPTAGKVAALLVNLAVALYLIVRIRKEKSEAN